MPGNPLVRFDEGRVGRTARCRPLSYSTATRFLLALNSSLYLSLSLSLSQLPVGCG
jgi:hypothetical protein